MKRTIIISIALSLIFAIYCAEIVKIDEVPAYDSTVVENVEEYFEENSQMKTFFELSKNDTLTKRMIVYQIGSRIQGKKLARKYVIRHFSQ